MLQRFPLLLGNCLFVLYAVGQDYQFIAGPTATAQFQEYEHNFGRIEQQSAHQHSFRFQNSGLKPLMIDSVSSSCSCLQPYYSKGPIQPGEQGEIRVIYQPGNQEGRQQETLMVNTNAFPKDIQLKVRADIHRAGINAAQQQNESAATREGIVVLKPWQAYDTRDGRVLNMLSSDFKNEKVEIGYANNQIVSFPVKKDGQVVPGGSRIRDHGAVTVDAAVASQGGELLSSGSTKAVRGHCYSFSIPGHGGVFVKILEVSPDQSIRLQWRDTDNRVPLRLAIKESKSEGAVTRQRLQGEWAQFSGERQSSAMFNGDSVSFGGSLANHLGSGPFGYTLREDRIDIHVAPTAPAGPLVFKVFIIGNRLLLFEDRKDRTNLVLRRAKP